jgi:hypothetical protein
MVTGPDLDRLLYGDILEAFSTELFGSDITRSPEAEELLQSLAQLNYLELSRPLSNEQKQEQDRLRAALPTSAYMLPNSRTVEK